MKIFVAGATGVIGRQLLPRLMDRGHLITGLTRTEEGAHQLRAAGATAVVADVFDQARVRQAIIDAAPEVVIHQLTSLADGIDPRHFNESLAQTNRLRTEGTRILMDAALAAGARRFVAQSLAASYTPQGRGPAREEEPLYLDAPDSFVEGTRALDRLERTVLQTPGIEGIALRYGYFYGPGTIYALDGSFTGDLRKRRVPIIGKGEGIFSFVHVADAAAATVLAVESGEPGIYNIVDDEPAALHEWLPELAKIVDAPRPMRIPKVAARLAAGRFGVFWATEQRGASNQKARQALGWQPQYRSWREGFRAELATPKAMAIAA